MPRRLLILALPRVAALETESLSFSISAIVTVLGAAALAGVLVVATSAGVLVAVAAAGDVESCAAVEAMLALLVNKDG